MLGCVENELSWSQTDAFVFTKFLSHVLALIGYITSCVLSDDDFCKALIFPWILDTIWFVIQVGTIVPEMEQKV